MMNKLIFRTAAMLCAACAPAVAQVSISGGAYSQNFNSLAISGTSNPWTDNSTLPGWYLSKTAGGAAVTTYRADAGTSIAGAIYSYGSGSSTERALGSIASVTPGNLAFGVRFTNDTPGTITNLLVTYTGEQWRNGGNDDVNALAFSYRIGSSLTNSDAANANAWTSFPALTFNSPTISTNASALDGNVSSNRQVFTGVSLTVSIAPGQEMFLRWFDANDLGNDYGLAVDDLTVTFNGITNPPVAPVITLQPESQSVYAGDLVSFTTAASGNPAPTYQWQWYGTNLPGQTLPSLTLAGVTTNQSGPYRVVVSNSAGSTNSDSAILTVLPLVAGFTLMTYNTKGFGTTDWSTNAPQVQAIGRQLIYLNPDIITFQEIPYTNRYQMVNWIPAFLPGYYLATNSATDGLLCSVIASRFPITRSSRWLTSADLAPFGYTAADFTRDLFEAQIAVPGFPQPLHVFTVHLKSGQGTDDSSRRSAEAGCISNYFVTGFLTTNSLRPYVLTGDMNEDINDPPSSNPQSIQKLISTPTGLRLTTPVNPFTSSRFTFSIQTSPYIRYDYILPSSLLFSNIATSQVFRTDVLPSPPPPLLGTDSATGSDHMPVLMRFNNPYGKPFKLTSVTRSNTTVTLKWETILGQPYRVESSTNLQAWSTLATNLVATNFSGTLTYSTNLNEAIRFFRIARAP
jgi:endonuclease/exonuclease/phosphatase family metal-dependent hydrolase